MKKISIILLSAFFAGACFIVTKSTQIEKLTEGLNVTQLFSLNQAIAEVNQDGEVEDTIDCTYSVSVSSGPPWATVTITYDYSGTRDTCVKGPGSCSPTLCS